MPNTKTKVQKNYCTQQKKIPWESRQEEYVAFKKVKKIRLSSDLWQELWVWGNNGINIFKLLKGKNWESKISKMTYKNKGH